MASIFASNPFSSPVGQRIESATDPKLASEDWSLNLEICDIINETDEGPKDAIKAIRKRLSTPKDFKAIMLTLTVIETCVKNCNKRFHVLVCNKEFLNEMTKLLQPKYNAPTIVQDRILSLIQTWADAFKGKPEFEGIANIYQSLKSQGIQFPAQDLDTFSPIFTPERSVPEQPAPVSQTRQQIPPSATMTTTQYHHNPPAAPAPASRRRMLSPEKLAKLRSQMDIVQANIQVMSEMLSAMTAENQNQEDHALLKELNRTCRAMQTRIVQLLDQIGSEEVTEELLRVNDDLNNVFIRYDRYERNMVNANQTNSEPAIIQPSHHTEQGTVQLPPISEPAPNTGSLIDFNDIQVGTTNATSQQTNDRVTSQFANLGLTEQEPGRGDDDFDMFAQTRMTTLEDSRRGGSTYEDNSSSLPDRTLSSALSDQPNEEASAANVVQDADESTIKGLEDWLTVSDLPASPPNDNGTTSMTSSEFDEFLQQRAVSGGSRKSKSNQNQMNNDVDESEEMFKL